MPCSLDVTMEGSCGMAAASDSSTKNYKPKTLNTSYGVQVANRDRMTKD